MANVLADVADLGLSIVNTSQSSSISTSFILAPDEAVTNDTAEVVDVGLEKVIVSGTSSER